VRIWNNLGEVILPLAVTNAVRLDVAACGKMAPVADELQAQGIARKLRDTAVGCAICTSDICTTGPAVQPEQVRAARAILNWSLERLAEASGVHRNTISNCETRKYDGEPEKLATIKHTLEAAGVIFTEENGEATGAELRRFGWEIASGSGLNTCQVRLQHRG